MDLMKRLMGMVDCQLKLAVSVMIDEKSGMKKRGREGR